MTLHIPPDVEQLARYVAIKTGQTPEAVVKEAIEARALAAGVTVTSPRRSPAEIERRIKEISERVSALPILDDRSNDEIIGYDEFGIPK